MKALEDIDTPRRVSMSWTVVPNFRALGPRLGPKVNEVKARAAPTADGSELRRQLDEQGCDRDRRRAHRAPTRSRCAPTATRRSRSPRTARGPWPSTSSSTTTSAPKAPPANSSARSTTCARNSASTSPTASRWRSPLPHPCRARRASASGLDRRGSPRPTARGRRRCHRRGHAHPLEIDGETVTAWMERV